MDTLSQFIRPELLVLAPVLYVLGAGLSKLARIPDNFIPLILGAVGITLSLAYVLSTCTLSSWRDGLMAAFTAVTQGILCAGASVFVSQLVKRAGKSE